MFNSLYPFKQQKRNFPEDSPHYFPSLKRTRLWDESLEGRIQQNHFNVNPTDLIRNTSPNLRVMNKPEYFPAVCINDPFQNVDLIEFKYMPDLNAAQNPHYYEYNKLLFELYLERTRRCKPHNQSSSQSPI